MFGNKLGKIGKLIEKNNAEKLEALLKDKDMEVVLAAIDGLGKCMLQDRDAASLASRVSSTLTE